MNTKEAIEFTKDLKFDNCGNCEHNRKIDGVIELLHRHEKSMRIDDSLIHTLREGKNYKKMWNEFIYGLAHINIGSYRNPRDEELSDLTYINILIKDLKRKYFPNKKEEKTINKMEEMIKTGQDLIKELADTLLFVAKKWDLKDK